MGVEPPSYIQKMNIPFSLKYLIRTIIGIIFCVSSIMKLCSIDEFELYIFSIGIFNYDISTFVARILLIIEFSIGSCFIINIYDKISKWIASLLLIIFNIYLIWRIILNDNSNCHCFGNIIELNPVNSIVKNIILCIMLAFSWKIKQTNKKYHIYIVTAIFVVYTMLVFIYSPPNFFYNKTPDKLSINKKLLAELTDEYNINKNKHIICFYSTNCKYCRRCASKISSIIKQTNTETFYFHVFFIEDNHYDIDEFNKKYLSNLKIKYNSIPPEKIIPIVKGALPTIVFIQDGKYVSEYDYLSINEISISSFLQAKTQK